MPDINSTWRERICRGKRHKVRKGFLKKRNGREMRIQGDADTGRHNMTEIEEI
jgi:hypothetical protein